MSLYFSHCLVFETSSEPTSVMIGKYHKIQAFPTGTLVESCENQLTNLAFLHTKRRKIVDAELQTQHSLASRLLRVVLAQRIHEMSNSLAQGRLLI